MSVKKNKATLRNVIRRKRILFIAVIFLNRKQMSSDLPSKITKQQLLESFDTFVFDADGVLWRGDNPIQGASDWINCLLDAKPTKRVFITTNNATKTLEQYIEKVKKMGFGRLNDQNLISPAIVLSDYLSKRPEIFKNQQVYLIGTKSLQKTLEANAGVKCFGVGPDPADAYTEGDFINEVDVSTRPKAVILGFDSRFSYPKLMKAANYLADSSVQFLVTNEDYTFPGPVPNMILPETGPWSAAIQAVTGRKPDVVFGKPHKSMADFLRLRSGDLDPRRTVMFGDRLDTDVMFGNSNGFSTVWMPTGTNTVDDIKKAKEKNEILKIPNFTCLFSEF